MSAPTSSFRTILASSSRSLRPTLRPRIQIRPSSSSSAPPPTGPRFTTAKPKSEWKKPTTILLMMVPFVTGYLGWWQIQRLRWKLDLIDEVDRNMEKPPMLLPSHINLAAIPDFSFRRVLVKGQFSGPPILLGPHTYDGIAGYHLILPFHRSDGGSTILLNRGFITTTRATAIRNRSQSVPGLTADGQSTGEEVVIEGLLPKTGEKSGFTPDNKLETNEWFWKDVDLMAEVAGGAEQNVQPVLVDAIAEPEISPTLLMQQGTPVGRPPVVELRNQHAQYAAIWLSLCASTTVMVGWILTKGRAGGKGSAGKRPKLY
ncbi:hypothetical protein L202_08113 [Cryptococcus amylolentus CBS 6039]|uniref:SURF1-like protein n=2 Tax=Cryptococcus amylolentus TaxID=104669 RepID=A0A1E3H8P2_9TREE|nr:hypothetical protein L202_08113 [Cryptococcus amylolentus CBS 6039]ODN72673.1 hypothetical protein L202_08113 [Cryptococcus amylolentus CBS 6039]ODN97883.1 hypothetical protein I350_07518 [Cryptococcus amylolentus CBS 6273]